MSLYTLVLPLLMACAVALANRFWGGSVTYYPKAVYPDGSHKVEFRFKQTFDRCEYLNWTVCSGDCGTVTSLEKGVIYNTSGRNAVNFNWCQTEVVATRQIPIDLQFSLRDTGCCWVNITPNFGNWQLFSQIRLGERSDTNKINRSPFFTGISFVRVPQNCPRTFKLIMFDPDKDKVTCGYTYVQPAGFTLSQTIIKEKDFCTLSYNNATADVYGIALIVFEFVKQRIYLSYTNGSNVFFPGGSPISILPLQFAVKVDPAVASCVEGVYLPKFLPPTPETGDQIQAVINQELQIIIKATASAAGVCCIITSGPLNITVERSKSSSEEFVLRWTPRSEDLGEYFPICFIAESNQVNNTYYQSDMRCIIAEVGPADILIGLRMKIQSKTPLTETEIEQTVFKQFHEELIRNGLPNTTTLSLRRVHQVNP